MNSAEVVENPTNVAKNKNWTMIVLMTVSIIPILAAYTMFYTGVGVPDHTVNKGVLLPKAVQLQTLFSNADPEFVEELNSNKKWRLIIPFTGQCSKACQQNLYTTRQVHIRLAQHSERIERVAVNIDGAAGELYFDSIKAEHPKLKLVTIARSVWDQWLAKSESGLDVDSEPFYLLVDQEGFAMMSYTQAQHGNELLKDLKRALKYSIDYQK